jgi:hypothetical protein
VRAFVADVASGAHPSLSGLSLRGMALNAPGMLDAVVDVVIARKLSCVEFLECMIDDLDDPEGWSAGALARVLSDAPLTALSIEGNFGKLLDVDGCALICAALRSNPSLTSLEVTNTALLRGDAASALTMLLCTLVALPRLRKLDLSGNDMHGRAAVYPHHLLLPLGAALGALVRANTPALVELKLWFWVTP